ncbi:Gfo/Idh/MocA family protein [Wocania ichthyoenteri]|uniref:Gfo/Idh/MocA family protein n=1 Tax=Wocania ichthyoenteri TaxID=1230531 RepID=UPI00053D45F4|nr:Gfo/Idh/MocA family oxidoreductase [Wocania ichthyoenteri]
MKKNNRRNFIKMTSIAGAGITMIGSSAFAKNKTQIKGQGSVGIVGMDTSHSPILVKAINRSENGYIVTTAFTTVSLDFPLSTNRVEKFTAEIKSMGIEIVSTIEELLDKVDFVLLCTVDGRLHLKQAEKILKAGKRVFIDKPMATSLKNVIEIFNLSKKYNIPTFTSSAVRFMDEVQMVRKGNIGKVLGADTYAPVSYQPIYPELYWYGIHGIEMLFTLMKTGCQKVKRLTTNNYDIVTGVWDEGRIGNYRGMKNKMGKFGGQAFGNKGVSYLGEFMGFEPLHHAILYYFDTGKAPVQPKETIEIFAFMEAAHESSRKNGEWITIRSVLDKAGYTK